MQHHFERFFQVGDEVPVLERFTFDSAERGITLLILLIVGFICVMVLRKCSEEKQTLFLKTITTAMLLFYSLKYFGNLNDYVYGNPAFESGFDRLSFIFGKLPLNLCNLSMFSNVVAAYTKRRGAMAFSYSLMIPGAILALAFPERPYLESIRVISFDYFQFYLVHGLAILVPVLFLSLNWYRPRRKDAKVVMLTGGIIFVILYFANYIFDANLSFLRFASPGTPMVMFYDVLPQPFYAITLYVLSCIICYIMLAAGEAVNSLFNGRKKDGTKLGNS